MVSFDSLMVTEFGFLNLAWVHEVFGALCSQASCVVPVGGFSSVRLLLPVWSRLFLVARFKLSRGAGFLFGLPLGMI